MRTYSACAAISRVHFASGLRENRKKYWDLFAAGHVVIAKVGMYPSSLGCSECKQFLTFPSRRQRQTVYYWKSNDSEESTERALWSRLMWSTRAGLPSTHCQSKALINKHGIVKSIAYGTLRGRTLWGQANLKIICTVVWKFYCAIN